MLNETQNMISQIGFKSILEIWADSQNYNSSD